MPKVVDIVTGPTLAPVGLPRASRAVTVMVTVEDVSTSTCVTLGAIVELVALTGPGTKLTVAELSAVPPDTVKVRLAVAGVTGAVSWAVYVPSR